MNACDMKLRHDELNYMTAMKVMLAGSEINPSLLKPRVPLLMIPVGLNLCAPETG